MPNKKIKYNCKIDFNPTEANINADNDEPEHFKYGVYFNDGYDYMKHLISREDFLNETQNLQEITSKSKKNLSSKKSRKPIDVVKEFVVEDEADNEKAIEKLKEISKGEIDEDIINALNSDGEYSELEDDFIDIANGDERYESTDGSRTITGDAELFNRFISNNDQPIDEMEDDDDACEDDDNHDQNFRLFHNFRDPINEISKNIDFDNAYNCNTKRQRLSSSNIDTTEVRPFSLSLLNALEREENKEEKKVEYVPPGHDLKEFFSSYSRDETEYDEADVDRAVDSWINGNAKKSTGKTKSNFIREGEVTACKRKNPLNQPILVSVPIDRPERQNNAMEVSDGDSDEQSNEIQLTNVNVFHVPRPKDENSEERNERKRLIKEAKRARRSEKKDLKNSYKIAKSTVR